jgi:hypothetical protein
MVEADHDGVKLRMKDANPPLQVQTNTQQMHSTREQPDSNIQFRRIGVHWALRKDYRLHIAIAEKSDQSGMARKQRGREQADHTPQPRSAPVKRQKASTDCRVREEASEKADESIPQRSQA